jgi:hypothetical protein
MLPFEHQPGRVSPPACCLAWPSASAWHASGRGLCTGQTVPPPRTGIPLVRRAQRRIPSEPSRPTRAEGPGLTSLRRQRAAALGSGRVPVRGLLAHLRATAQATSAPLRRSIMMLLMFVHGIGLNVILRSSKPGIQGIYLFNDFDGC